MEEEGPETQLEKTRARIHTLEELEKYKAYKRELKR